MELSINEILSVDSYVSYDIETTSFKPDRNYGFIIEIGAVKVVNGKIVDQIDLLIKPGIPIPKKITAITNISNEDVKNADNITTALLKFKRFIGDVKYLVGHNNEKFDKKFVEYWSNETNIIIDNPNIDVCLLAKKILNKNVLKTKEAAWLIEKGKEKVSYSLEALCYAYDIVDNNHHRADNDAKITHFVFKALRDEFNGKFNKVNLELTSKKASEKYPDNYYLISINYWEKRKIKRIYVDVTDSRNNIIRKGTVFYDFGKENWNIKQTPFPIINFSQIEDKTKAIFKTNIMDVSLMANKKVYFGNNPY